MSEEKAWTDYIYDYNDSITREHSVRKRAWVRADSHNAGTYRVEMKKYREAKQSTTTKTKTKSQPKERDP